MTTLWTLGVLAVIAIPLGLGLWKSPRVRRWLQQRRRPVTKALVAPLRHPLALRELDIEADALTLEVELGKSRIEDLLRAFAPVRIHLTPYDEDTRYIEIEEPEDVTMLPGRGVLLRARGKLHYTVAGMTIEREIRSAEVLLIPAVVGEDQSSRLAFDIEILSSDIAGVPGILDDALASKVNGRLDWKHTRLAWNFGQTLSTAIRFPERLEPLDRLITRVSTSSVHVGHDGVRFEVGIDPSLTRLRTRPTDDA